ncbi:MAG: methyltransferase domain-containing protein [Tepidisphaeraceae bacterium]
MPRHQGQPHHESDEYVLGTHDEELTRLGFQHQIWRSQMYALWERAGFVPGRRMLDVGCGPGFTTVDLAQIVGPSGQVTAVDVSERFIAHLRSLNHGNITGLVHDVQDLQLPPASFDAAYERWVLCFVPNPQDVIEGVAKSLRSGGVFAIQDYYNYSALKLAPPSRAMERVVAAVNESWKQRGGDPDVGCRLPEMLQKHGFRITHLAPIVRLATPESLLWQWPTTFFRSYVLTLVKLGLLSDSEAREFDEDWTAHTHNPAAFFTTPPVIEIVAVKA